MGLLDGTTQNKYYSGSDHGNYQFTSLENIINQFMIAYVGEEKIISKAKRSDVAFHAQRALAELSFDTLKSIKAQEITVPTTLKMILPQDYVNYTKVSWVDSAGIKHPLYPTSKTSNPSNPIQDANGDFQILAEGTFTLNDNKIVLDKEYSNIQCGMIVRSTHVPASTAIITGWTTDGTYTTIELGSFAPQTFPQIASVIDFDSQETGVFDIIIENANGDLIQSENSSYTAASLTPSSLDDYITVSATDATNIEVGMIVATSTNAFIPQNTFVTAVNDTKITISNPTQAPPPSAFHVNFISPLSDSDTWNNYKSPNVSETNNNDDYDDDTYWPMMGGRYGLDPQHAQANGSFYIDNILGKIHFSSNISGKTVILDYISDSLGTNAEMQVHKFAEEAMYKSIAYAILSTRINTQEYIVKRYKKEKFAETRKAKLRLSNIKLEELTQILRGKSKQIKH
jgi:hypothetical protein